MIEDALWKILAFILAMILMFVAPLMTMYDRLDAITYSVAFSAANELADLSRELGQVKELNYLTLMDKLNATGNTYTVEMEHYKKVYVPVYDNAGVFQDDYEIVYEGTFTHEIQEALRVSGSYEMEAGDLFYVHIENKSQTGAQVARNLLLRTSENYPVIIVRSGGMVHHESN